jgi:hypothetical protein
LIIFFSSLGAWLICPFEDDMQFEPPLPRYRVPSPVVVTMTR